MIVRLAETDAHEGPVYVAADDAIWAADLTTTQGA
jgi:hypothetical protein